MWRILVVVLVVAVGCLPSDADQTRAPSDTVVTVPDDWGLTDEQPSQPAPVAEDAEPAGDVAPTPDEEATGYTVAEQVIESRLHQRLFSIERNGFPDETPSEARCVVETAIYSLPEEVLPQLTDPAQAELTFETVDLFAGALAAAAEVCT
ncbi:MAG: hypothetical protein ACR2QE_11175 [Acidimicrobiales bacterium]